MTRRTRRRLTVLALAAVAGAGSPLWAPPLLRTLPAFQVEQVEVTGAHFVVPEEVRARADIPRDASVWDDSDAWEARVRGHRLVEDVQVARRGWRTLEIRVSEVEPVALVTTRGVLRPVDRRGVLLPLDPTRHRLDLPLVRGEPEIRDDRVRSAAVLRELEVVWELVRRDSAFLARVSEVEPVRGEAVRMWMMDEAPVERVLLPVVRPAEALGRVEAALGVAGPRAEAADARFEDQVVLRVEERGK